MCLKSLKLHSIEHVEVEIGIGFTDSTSKNSSRTWCTFQSATSDAGTRLMTGKHSAIEIVVSLRSFIPVSL